MTNPKLLLQELHWVLRRAWDERTLPASVVPADLVRRIEACLTDEPSEHPALKAGDELAHQSVYTPFHERWWQARGGHDKCTVCVPEKPVPAVYYGANPPSEPEVQPTEPAGDSASELTRQIPSPRGDFGGSGPPNGPEFKSSERRNITTVSGIECMGYMGRHPSGLDSDERLSRCPFCGSIAAVRVKDKVGHDAFQMSVECVNTSCGVKTPEHYATRENAIEAWNRRDKKSEGSA